MKTSNMSKLSFYRKYKSDHYKIARYITPVNNRRHKVLWQSSEAVNIDSKLKLVDILKFIMNIPPDMNNCQEKKEFVIYAKIK